MCLFLRKGIVANNVGHVKEENVAVYVGWREHVVFFSRLYFLPRIKVYCGNFEFFKAKVTFFSCCACRWLYSVSQRTVVINQLII